MPDDHHDPEIPPPGPPSPQPAPKQKRRWWRLALKAFAVILVLVVLFHRPLLQWTLSAVLHRLAARQNVSLELDISGSMFTNLTVGNVRAVPTGKGESPVGKIAIKYLHFEYSIPRLIKGGIGEFLKSYEIRNADLEIVAKPPKSEAERRQKRTLAEDLNNLLAQPALYADEVGVENFNLKVQGPEEVTRVEGLHLFLHPNKQGWLRVAAVELPKLPVWRNLSAVTSYARRNLIITGLKLDEQIDIDRFRFDASRRAEDRGSLSLESHLFGGALQLSLEGRKLPREGENLKKSYDTALLVAASGINISSAVAYFGGKKLPPTRLTELKINVRGEPERPNTWTGNLSTRFGRAAVGDTTLDEFSFAAEVTDGFARLTQGGTRIGENTLTLTGEARLPDSINRLGETDLEFAMKIDAPDLQEATSGFLPEAPVRGRLTGAGTITLKDKRLGGTVAFDAENLAHTGFQVATGEIKGTFARPLKTAPGAPLQGLDAKIAAQLSELRYETYKIDSAEVEAVLSNNRLHVTELALETGENLVNLKGQFVFPEGRAIPEPIETDFSIKLPELAAISLHDDEDFLKGRIMGEGSLRTVNDRLTGTVTLEASGVRHGEDRADSLSAKVNIDETEGTTFSLDAESVGRSDMAVETADVTGSSSDVIQRLRDGRWQEVDGELKAALTGVRYKKFRAKAADIEAESRNGEVKVTKFQVKGGKSAASADSGYQRGNRPEHSPATGEESVATNGDTLGGGNQGNQALIDRFNATRVYAQIKAGEAEQTDGEGETTDAGGDSFSFEDIEFTGGSSNILQILNDSRWDQLNGTFSVKLTKPTVKDFTADTAVVKGTARDGLLTLEELTIERAENVASAEGTFRFPPGKPLPRPVDAKFSLDFPNLAAFGVEVNKDTLDGQITAEGFVRSVNDKLTGRIQFEGSNIVVDDFRAGELAGSVVVDEAEATDVRLRAEALRIKDFSVATARLTGQSSDLIQRLRDSRWRELDTNLNADVVEPRFRTYTAESGQIAGTTKDGLVFIENVSVRSAGNTASASGTFRLPEREGSPELIQAELLAKVNDMSTFEVAVNKEVLDGRVEGRVSLRSVDGQLNGTVQLEVANLTLGDFRADRIAVDGNAKQGQVSKFEISAQNITSPDLALKNAEITARADNLLTRAGGGFLENLEAEVSANLSQVRYKTVNADEVDLVAGIDNRLATIEKLLVTRGENSLTADGSIRIPGAGAAPVPVTLNYSIAIPELAEFGIKVKDALVRGSLEGSGAVRTENGELQGSARISGSALGLDEFTAKSLEASVRAAGEELIIEELRVQIAPDAEIAARGRIGMENEQPYEGAVVVLMKDLAVLEPLLAALDMQKELGGSVDLTVESSGQWKPQRHEGDIKLEADNARYGEIRLDRVRIAGIFGPQFADATEFHIVSGPTQLSAAVSWQEKKLRIRDIELRQGPQQVLTGFAMIPFDPGSAGGLIPMDQRIAANLNARDLKIEQLMKTIGQTSPVNGSVTINLVAGGTILRPTLHVKLAARSLTTRTAPKLRPAEVDLVAHYSNKELTVDLTARQPQIQPLTVRGSIPVDLEEAIQQKKLDPNLPLDLTVNLPPTSLGILADLVPSIRSIEGTTSINGRVGGTVQDPEFSGAAMLRVGYARFRAEGVPAIGRLEANIAFTNDGLQIQTFRGEIGGGSFQISGGIRVPSWFEPVFNLRLLSDSVLVHRDDALTVRVDSDLEAVGPLKAGTVRGTIWPTQSRYFRDIEILPIGLPGRPKPRSAPKAAPSERSFAITKPPFSNWTFDVAIKTRPDDPFEVRGNLASGNAAVDLRFGGTGAEPWLEGTVRVEDFRATLPFSELEVTNGFITFSRDEFLRPNLDIMAKSQLRDYHINAYIYGTPENPQLSLNSEPPLPQQDIISLLATGTTTAELSGGSDVLAGRAAVLVLEQLYRKIFKRRPGAEKDPFMDRFEVDLGAVDSRTGRQEVSATFKLGENLYLVGDLDVTGEFTGRLRYLIRFR